MACVDTTTRFRLLDAYVGWDPDRSETKGISGLDDPFGLRLKDPDRPEIPNDVLSAFVPPPWLAHGCRACEWYLCSQPQRNSDVEPSVLRHDPCHSGWYDVRPQLSEGRSLRRPVCVHVWKRRLAVADEGCDDAPGKVFIWSIPDGRLAGYVELAPCYRPLAIALAPWCELVVSVEHKIEAGKTGAAQRLLRFDRSGDPRGELQLGAGNKPLQRLASGSDGALWAAEGEPEGPFHLWRIIPVERSLGPRHNTDTYGTSDLAPPSTAQRSCSRNQVFLVQQVTDLAFHRQADQQLRRLFRPTGLVSVRADRFCLKEPTVAGSREMQCFARDGSPSLAAESARTIQAQTFREGTLVTQALDSFIPRCRWHRIRLEADVPADTSIALDLATSERKTDFPQDDQDWQQAPENATDLLIQQPPGRYLFLRIRLTSSHTASPTICRVRIDFPRASSLEQLPAVYREDPAAEDFADRFLSLFDAATEDLDRAIERFPALFNPAGVPDEVLPWLGAFLGIVFDPTWDADRRRRLLQAAPALYRKRGTVAGLREAIDLLFGVHPITRQGVVIQERVFQRAWGAISADARLGSVRLFGKSRARFRIGRSALNSAPLRSYGNPDHDPLRSESHQFTVLMPPCPGLNQLGIDQLERLIAHQKPAHTVHTLRVGGQGFIIGRTSVVGIDTRLQATPPPVLGSPDTGRGISGNVRLNRTSVLRPGPHGCVGGLRVGKSLVGINTLLE